jgi:hypothetical protein
MAEMIEITTEVEGVEEAVAALKALGVHIPTVVAPAFQRGAMRAEAKLKEYPPPIPEGLWARYSTPKMRAYFFGVLLKSKAGKKQSKDGRYRRTLTLGRRWTTELSVSSNMIRASVGNNTKYGPFVQSIQRQVGFHKDRWITDRAALEAVAQETVEDVQQTIVNAAAAYGGAA